MKALLLGALLLVGSAGTASAGGYSRCSSFIVCSPYETAVCICSPEGTCGWVCIEK